MIRFLSVVLTVIVLWLPAITFGQMLKVFKLSVTPVGQPMPALKHSLLPEYLKQTPGNAAQYYYRANLFYQTWDKARDRKFYDQFDKWIKSPPDQLPKEKVRKVLSQFESTYQALKTAAYREHCYWDWRMQDLRGSDTIAFMLPEAQESRELARILALKARLEISEGRYDDALETFRIGYKQAIDVAIPPTIINDLIGIAISSIMNDQLIEMINSPNSPNLYWAIAQFPRPFIEMQPALEYERSMPVKMFPFLLDPETAERSPEQWKRIIVSAMQKAAANDLIPGIDKDPKKKDLRSEEGATKMIMGGYPRARLGLIESGYSQEKVDAMSVGQVIAIYQAQIYRYTSHEMFKWANLPFAQAYQGMKRTNDHLKKEGYLTSSDDRKEIIPIASSLLPAVMQARTATARLQTRMAGIQVLEAIRMHAAEKNGQLPKSLDQISVVPVPNDPSTGKPFAYRLQGDKAVLDVVVSKEFPQVNWKFEITLRSDEK